MSKWYFPFLAAFLFSCSQDSGTIKVKGSDTEVNLAVQVAEAFHQVKPKVFVSISGGGSGLGITSLLNGTADLANSSRSINDKELELFEKKKIVIDSFVFAQDAIAFVVSEDMPLDSISTDDLSKILSGEYRDWSALIKTKMAINIYGRQSNSGTHDFVKKKLKIEFSQNAKEMNGNAQILEAIRADHSGIGYVGAGYVAQGGGKGLRVLSIYTDKDTRSISPLDSAMIAKGKYFFQRPLFQYFKVGSYEKVKPFLDFEKSEKGQNIIRSAGYYAVQ